MSEQIEKSCADCRIIGSSRCYLVCDNLSLYEPTEKSNTETNDLNSENNKENKEWKNLKTKTKHWNMSKEIS